MFIGGVFCAVAMMLGLQFWLIPICFTMIMSSISVIIQRVYFKATGGKRIFKMSPIHHHFELSGMKENQIVMMYALATLVLSIAAVLAALPLMR
jgi:phospho-N-acetylmuramoyl-pentapeptide-transferase